MANIDSVQLPDGSNFNIVDNTSNFATQTYVDNAVSGITKTTIGLGNVDNTSDLNKPVSTVQQTAIDNAVAPKADQTLLAPVESTSTASQTYQIGDQFIYNGLLYKATAVINSGGTITPDGNCELSDSITEQIANSGSSSANKLGSGVSLNSYTKTSPYTFPSDGYLSVVAYNNVQLGSYLMGSEGWGTGGSVTINVYAPASKFNTFGTFVRKGMKFGFDSTVPSGSGAYFNALV